MWEKIIQNEIEYLGLLVYNKVNIITTKKNKNNKATGIKLFWENQSCKGRGALHITESLGLVEINFLLFQSNIQFFVFRKLKHI